jgi:hypothetical protein
MSAASTPGIWSSKESSTALWLEAGVSVFKSSLVPVARWPEHEPQYFGIDGLSQPAISSRCGVMGAAAYDLRCLRFLVAFFLATRR